MNMPWSLVDYPINVGVAAHMTIRYATAERGRHNGKGKERHNNDPCYADWTNKLLLSPLQQSHQNPNNINQPTHKGNNPLQ